LAGIFANVIASYQLLYRHRLRAPASGEPLKPGDFLPDEDAAASFGVIQVGPLKGHAFKVVWSEPPLQAGDLRDPLTPDEAGSSATFAKGGFLSSRTYIVGEQPAEDFAPFKSRAELHEAMRTFGYDVPDDWSGR